MNSYINQFSIIHRQSFVQLKQQLKQLSITSGQFMYLMLICEEEGKSQDYIRQTLMLDKGSAARTLKQLEDDGYITREVCAGDKRQYRLYPTQKARQLYPKIRQITDGWERQMLSHLSGVEKQILENILTKVVRNVTETEHI